MQLTKEQEVTLEESKKILSGEKELQLSGTVGKGFSSRYIETVWAASHLRGVGAVLDVGFSLSSLDTLGMLLACKARGVALEAVDIINPEKVKSRYPEEWRTEVLQVPVTVGDVRTLPLPEGKYDTVTCISTIEHIGYDAPSSTVAGSAFERHKNKADVRTERGADVDNAVLTSFHKVLKQDGRVLLSVPMGRGGPVLLQDSLGLYCVEWEYEKQSWEALTSDKRFVLEEELFFKNTPEGWVPVDSPEALRDVTETLDAQGVGLALCVLRKQ